MAIAYRGSTKLKDDISLQAHLASLLRLENVGLLLGAGASVPAGGLVVKALWNDFVEQSTEAAEWLVEQDLVERLAIAGDGEREVPNVEELLDKLAIAITEWERVDDAKLARGKGVRADLYRAVVRAAVLNEEWWQSPRGVEFHEEGLKHHRAILQKITAARQPGQPSPWVFTTNYDLAIEWAAESIDMSVINGFLGLHNRRFSPQSFDLGYRNTQARGEARFGVYNIYLAKLHGSLTWKEDGNQLFEVQAAQAWSDIQSFIAEISEDLSYMVLPSAAKYVQTTGFVLGELLRRFAEFLARPQTSLIIAGYGFGDEHINRLLSSALLNPTLQLVIYLPEFTGMDQLENLPTAVQRLISLQNPRVTIVGSDAQAYLDALASDLPEPAVYDDSLKGLEQQLRDQMDGRRDNELEAE